MSDLISYEDSLARLKKEQAEHQRQVDLAKQGLDICSATIEALERMIAFYYSDQKDLSLTDNSRSPVSDLDIGSVLSQDEDNQASDHSPVNESDMRYPARRLTQRIVDVLFYIGEEGATREQAAAFAEKAYGTKQASTKSMLQTNARKYGFVEQKVSGYYQLTDRGAQYLKTLGYTPSSEVVEARDVGASRASENTHSPE